MFAVLLPNDSGLGEARDKAVRGPLQRRARVKDHNHLFVNAQTGKPLGTFFGSWNQARKRAGLPDVRVHDLRHSYASFLINNGRTLYEVQRLLGHSQIKTTQRYAHLSPETLMAASNAASLAIGDLTGALPKAGEKMVSVRG